MENNEINSLFAIDAGYADPLPDYSVEPEEAFLFDLMDKSIRNGCEECCFWDGALSVLRILGSDENLSLEDIQTKSRKLIHECTYYKENH